MIIARRSSLWDAAPARLWLSMAVAVMGTTAQAADFAETAPTPFQVGELWGYRHADGAILIAPTFHVATPFTPEGTAAIAMDAGWAVIDAEGNVLLHPFTVDNWPDAFSEGLARFVEDGKIGFFDRAGRKVIPAWFDAGQPFSEGLAAVCRGCRAEVHGEHVAWTGGRWGYVNRAGKLVVRMRYEAAQPFVNGRADALLDGRWISIGADGEPAQPGGLICRFETKEGRVELTWDGSKHAGLMVDDGRRPMPLSCPMIATAARWVTGEPAFPRYAFEFDASACRAAPHAAAEKILSAVVLIIYPGHGNRGTLFWSEGKVMDECDFVQLGEVIDAKVMAAAPVANSGCDEVEGSACVGSGTAADSQRLSLLFEGAWVPDGLTDDADLCVPIWEEVAEGDFVIFDAGRLISGAGFGCAVQEIEEKLAGTFQLNFLCGGSNPHYAGLQRARIVFESADRMTLLFNGHETPMPYIRCHP